MSELKKYSVSIPWHASVIVKVKAKNEKEAAEQALADAYPSLCCHCSNEIYLDEANDDAEIDVMEVEE